MSRNRAVVRATAVAVGTLFAGALVAGGVAHAGSTGSAAAGVKDVLPQQFAADSGDACRMGFTRGTLAWLGAPGQPVAVRGSVTDRPTPIVPADICGVDDGRFTYATFTAFSGRRVVDTEVQRVNNGSKDFTFTLGTDDVVPPAINLVTVQVCRAGVRPSPEVCGPTQSYLPPIVVD